MHRVHEHRGRGDNTQAKTESAVSECKRGDYKRQQQYTKCVEYAEKPLGGKRRDVRGRHHAPAFPVMPNAFANSSNACVVACSFPASSRCSSATRSRRLGNRSTARSFTLTEDRKST